MPDTTYETIKLRRDTAANWTSANPVLVSGEPGFETDTGRLKVGDGSTMWASLPYITAYAYRRTMVANETIPYLSRVMVCSIDPGGADRILNPDAAFPAGAVIFLTNRGANAIAFDSAGINQGIGGGQKDFFVFDGTTWV